MDEVRWIALQGFNNMLLDITTMVLDRRTGRCGIVTVKYVVLRIVPNELDAPDHLHMPHGPWPVVPLHHTVWIV